MDGVSDVSVGPTTNADPALGTPLTVTTTGPVLAPLGTIVWICVEIQFVNVVAAAPLNVTVLVPCELPKFVPEIVTASPTRDGEGVTVVMVGVGSTVKLTPLLTCVATVTVTLQRLSGSFLAPYVRSLAFLGQICSRSPERPVEHRITG